MTTLFRLPPTAQSSSFHIGARWPWAVRRGLVGVALASVLIVATIVAPAVYAGGPAGTIAVDTTADEFGTVTGCSLREAVRAVNDGASFGGCTLSGTPPFTINLPAGTYELTIPNANEDFTATGDLDIRVSGTALVGAGAASTTIQQTTDDRVIDFNPTVASNFSGSLSNLTITGGEVGGTFGGGGIIYGDFNGGGTLTLNGVTVDGNRATQGPGGGIASGPRGNLTISNSTISNNTASSPAPGPGASAGTGGGIDFRDEGGTNTLNITNSTISGNRAAWTSAAGGGLYISGGTATIQRTHFVENLASNGAFPTGLGGAIAHGNGALTVSFSRFVGNAGIDGAAIWQSAGGGTTTANDNWWGVNTGPGAGVLAGTPLPTATRWLQLRHSANPADVPANTATTLTADLFGRNIDGPTDAANLVGLPPFPGPAGVIFNNAVAGTLSGAATQFTNGQATATYTAGPTTGPGSADASADGETETANINVTLAVLLAGFSAEAQSDQVLVNWETVSEIDNLGFNLWRGVSPDGPDTQLNASLIPSQAPGSTLGYSYAWTDQTDLVAGTTYFYWLEDVDANGEVTRHGPVSATFSAPTAVTLSELSANPAAVGSAAWGLPALLASLAAAATLARRRRR
ncbi:MAG TPA: right-handed parallel beta-helix repeat-containing protein [Anaerolineae bacterium]|nr:right-handed parallel beta-helix repeat-containing protein [Anaerolineae bacterium]